MIPDKPLFAGYGRECYETWKFSRLFTKWLSMKIQSELHPDDQTELEVIVEVLHNKPLREKWEDYQEIGDYKQQRMYRDNFLVIGQS